MCGLAGIYSNKPVAAELYDSLIHLQHRGQDAAGIITYKNRMHKSKGSGLVRDIFTDKKIMPTSKIKIIANNLEVAFILSFKSSKKPIRNRVTDKNK